jgi:hypothetical protein
VGDGTSRPIDAEDLEYLLPVMLNRTCGITIYRDAPYIVQYIVDDSSVLELSQRVQTGEDN